MDPFDRDGRDIEATAPCADAAQADGERSASVRPIESAKAHGLGNNIKLGILCRIGSALCFSGMGALVKIASKEGVPIFETIFFRSAFAFIPIGIFLLWQRAPLIPRTRYPLAHLRRAGAGILSMFGGFAAVSLLPFPTAIAIGFSAPLFLTILSEPMLRERVGAQRWIVTLVGFAGVAILLNPNLSDITSLGALLGLMGALFTAVAMISIRQLAHEPAIVTTFFFTIATTIVSLLSLPFGWVTPHPTLFGVLVSCGLIGGIGQLLLTQSMRLAPAVLVVSLDYTQIVWASLLGYLLWDEGLTPRGVIGGAIIIVCGCFIVISEVGFKSLWRIASTLD